MLGHIRREGKRAVKTDLTDLVVPMIPSGLCSDSGLV